MTWYLALKLVVVLVFLIMFVRRPSVVWGIGLLTVTTAALLDTMLDTFDSEALQADLGFFYFVLAGSIFAGAALWLWGLLVPIVRRSAVPAAAVPATTAVAAAQPQRAPQTDGFDVALLRQEIHERFGREDILDLMFDLGVPESEVMAVDQSLGDLVDNLLDYAQDHGRMGELALAVERILTPVPAEHLPRLEKLSPTLPPTILRQYLLAHYSLNELQALALALDVDWEQLDAGAKREKTRSLLQYLYRRNRITELVEHLQSGSPEQ